MLLLSDVEVQKAIGVVIKKSVDQVNIIILKVLEQLLFLRSVHINCHKSIDRELSQVEKV